MGHRYDAAAVKANCLLDRHNNCLDAVLHFANDEGDIATRCAFMPNLFDQVIEK